MDEKAIFGKRVGESFCFGSSLWREVINGNGNDNDNDNGDGDGDGSSKGNVDDLCRRRISLAPIASSPKFVLYC